VDNCGYLRRFCGDIRDKFLKFLNKSKEEESFDGFST
jgi:hypothetical protein